jgi:hypothetical protein
MALCCCWLLYRRWLGRPVYGWGDRVYRCLLGMVDSKQQQWKNSTTRCSLNTLQRQHTQHLLTTLTLVSTTPPRLQDYTKTDASLSCYTEVFLCPELHRVTPPKAPEYYIEAPNYYSDHSSYTEAAACYTNKAVEYYTEASKYYTETYCRALFVTICLLHRIDPVLNNG